MGWKGYETNIPAGMVFRKMYCHRCAMCLERQKEINTYKKGEAGFSPFLGGSSTIGMNEKQVTTFIYKCPNCGHEITYDNQCVIAKIQKKLKKTVLNQDEISDYCSKHKHAVTQEKTRIAVEFKGFISNDIQKYLLKKMFYGLLKVNIAILLLLGIPSVLAIMYFQMYIFLVIVLLGNFMSFLILFQLQKEQIPKRIFIEENSIWVETVRNMRQKSIFDIKNIIDNGAFYDITFYLPNTVHNCICQKDLIVQGTIEEFEKLFEDKIVRKYKQD
ncbi:MAG: hypothetical protein IJA89_07440 [Clostridia bacterium]|nr:hypothetical protein [Clostridia bacterium]